MKRLALALFAVLFFTPLLPAANAQVVVDIGHGHGHRHHRHCWYSHHHRHCRYR
jgi:hypothetical protein